MTSFVTDRTGSQVLERELPAGLCGTQLQAIDLAACEATNVAPIPAAPVP